VSERGIWIQIYGVPLHAWHFKFLDFITSSFGRLLKIDPCTTNLERFDFAHILVSTNCFDAINVVENILIDDKQYRIKFVEETEAVFACDICFEEEASNFVSKCSEHFDELHNEEPIVNALVHDLKEVWVHSVDKEAAAPSNAPSAAHNNHASTSFDRQQQQVSSPFDPVQPKDLEGQSSGTRAPSNDVCTGVASKINPTKATSCSNTRKSTSILGPWSFDWIKDHHVGDVAVVFFT